MTLRLLVAGLIGSLLLAGCGHDQEEAGVDDSGAVLRQQRLDVRARAVDLLDHAERRLSGTTTQSSGRYDGCDSTFNDEFRTFNYVAQARVDSDQVAGADELAGVLADAGFEAGDPTPGPGGRTSVKGTRDGLTAVLAVVADNPWVLVSVTGPCIEVPENQRQSWLDRKEPSPHLR